MADTVFCPACRARVPLVGVRPGRAVQCPSCKISFIPDRPANETVPIHLELPRPEPEDPEPAADADLLPPEQQPRAEPRPKRRLVGAVEVPVPQSEQPLPRPLPPEVHCRACGHPSDATRDRCDHCGAPLPRLDGPHRALEPHRGTLLRQLSIAGLAMVVIPPLGVLFSATAWVLSQIDLSHMEARTMNSAGYSMTRTAWICGLIGTTLNTVVGLIATIWIVLYLKTN
jgi:hypothetical protein